MPIKITIFDGAVPMLDKIAEVHYGQGLDALDHAGTKLREATRKAFRSSKTSIKQSYKNGKWSASKGRQQFRLGRRVSHKNKTNSDTVDNMESFITSYLMVDKMTMVVAGKHKAFTAKKRRNGKIEGSYKVPTITKGSYAILQKLNNGEAGKDYSKVTRTKAQHEMFDKMKWKRQNFIEQGRLAAMGEVRRIMTTKYQQMVVSQINRVNVKPRVVKSA